MRQSIDSLFPGWGMGCCKGLKHRSQILELEYIVRGVTCKTGSKATVQEGGRGGGRLPRETVINQDGRGGAWCPAEI